MIRSFLSLAVMFTCGTLAAQTPKIIVQGNGAPQVFDHFVDALAAANATNIMYLSGGSHILDGDVPVDHEVHIVGAGCYPDSAGLTQPTRLIGNATLIFIEGSSNSSITGLRLATNGSFQYGQNGQNNGTVTGMLWSRCVFEGNMSIVGENSATTFNECVLLLGVTGAVASSNFTLNNSIINGNVSGGFAQITMDHCLQLTQGGGSGNLSIYNSIIARDTPGGINYAGLFQNCLFYNVNDFTQNVIDCQFTTVNPFVNTNTTVGFEWADDFHIVGGSAAEGLASDGTDAGIYGGTAPAKPGFVPYNPHYIHLEIAPATDANGDLPVNITVKRQTY